MRHVGQNLFQNIEANKLKIRRRSCCVLFLLHALDEVKAFEVRLSYVAIAKGSKKICSALMAEAIRISLPKRPKGVVVRSRQVVPAYLIRNLQNYQNNGMGIKQERILVKITRRDF